MPRDRGLAPRTKLTRDLYGSSTLDDELLRLPNFIATPHIGASAEEARWRMGETAIQGLIDNFIPEPGRFPFEDR